jgi:hypothetical protein
MTCRTIALLGSNLNANNADANRRRAGRDVL